MDFNFNFTFVREEVKYSGFDLRFWNLLGHIGSLSTLKPSYVPTRNCFRNSLMIVTPSLCYLFLAKCFWCLLFFQVYVLFEMFVSGSINFWSPDLSKLTEGICPVRPFVRLFVPDFLENRPLDFVDFCMKLCTNKG